MTGDKVHIVVLSDESLTYLKEALVHYHAWVGQVAGGKQAAADLQDLQKVLAHPSTRQLAHSQKLRAAVLTSCAPEPETKASVAPALPSEVAQRMHRWGSPEQLFTEMQDMFFNNAECDGFESWETDWYDPVTGKAYHSFLKLEVEDFDGRDECPKCGDDLDWRDDLNLHACRVCGFLMAVTK